MSFRFEGLSALRRVPKTNGRLAAHFPRHLVLRAVDGPGASRSPRHRPTRKGGRRPGWTTLNFQVGHRQHPLQFSHLGVAGFVPSGPAAESRWAINYKRSPVRAPTRSLVPREKRGQGPGARETPFPRRRPGFLRGGDPHPRRETLK